MVKVLGGIKELLNIENCTESALKTSTLYIYSMEFLRNTCQFYNETLHFVLSIKVFPTSQSKFAFLCLVTNEFIRLRFILV